MLYKLGNDFGITGKLFLHIHSFLSDRLARLKINNVFGQWIESEIGTSAGTSLGPILFIVNVHNVPHSITPKFADDMVAVAIDPDLRNVEKKLQQATDYLLEWSHT